jgi:hypothetical protein
MTPVIDDTEAVPWEFLKSSRKEKPGAPSIAHFSESESDPLSS